MKTITAVLDAAAIVVSTMILTISDARTTAMIAVLRLLLVAMAILWVVKARRMGVLRMTPAETYRTADTRPRESVLGLVAIVLSSCALVFPVIRS